MIPREKNKTEDCCLVKIYEHIEERDNEDKILNVKDRCITSFYIKKYKEFLKAMWFAKEHNVHVYFNDYDSDIDRYNKKYNDPILADTIYDIWISLPSSESIMCINISI